MRFVTVRTGSAGTMWRTGAACLRQTESDGSWPTRARAEEARRGSWSKCRRQGQPLFVKFGVQRSQIKVADYHDEHNKIPFLNEFQPLVGNAQHSSVTEVQEEV